MRHDWKKYPELGAPAGGIPLPVARGFPLPQLAARVKGAKRRSEPLTRARTAVFCFGDGLMAQPIVFISKIVQVISSFYPLLMQESQTGPPALTLSSVGLKDRELEAFLKQDGSVLQRRTVKMVGRVGQLKFNLMPTTLGQQVFEVSLPVPEGDAVPENNRRDITASIQINSPPIPQVVATCWPSWPYPSGTIQWRYSFS